MKDVDSVVGFCLFFQRGTKKQRIEGIMKEITSWWTAGGYLLGE